MYQEFIGIAFGLCLFLIPLWAYRKGLKDGLSITQGKPVMPLLPNLNPAKALQEHKQAKIDQAQQDLFMQGLTNIMAFDGKAQKVESGEK
ncbi:MAG: hypothetical protein PHW65_04960 [Dehalococcoidales bacterium]|nr:hypothetical protein [Dehalococcoidales bacterium]